jgi:hypothetical protein
MRPEWDVYCPTCGMHTPNINALAKTGLLFTRAYCQQAICSPSRNSFMSGRRPDTTMAWNFKDSFRTSPVNGGGESWIALPEYFKLHGYALPLLQSTPSPSTRAHHTHIHSTNKLADSSSSTAGALSRCRLRIVMEHSLKQLLFAAPFATRTHNTTPHNATPH